MVSLWEKSALLYQFAIAVIAIVLLAASALKARQLFSANYSGSHWETGQAVAAITIEWPIAVWLLSGVGQKWARRTTIALFTVFLLVAEWRLFGAAADCGCFGQVPVSPAWTVSFDIAALALLLLLRPRRRTDLGPPPGHIPPAFRKIVAAVAVALVPAAAVASAVHRASPSSASGLVCQEPAFDFGEVPALRAGALTHEFVLRNDANHVIAVTDQITSCGCTVADLRNRRLLPGETTVVGAKVNWANRDGRQASTISLVTDEPSRSMITFRLVASVVNTISVWPRAIDFGELPPGLSDERAVRLLAHDAGTSARVVSVSATPRDLIVARILPPAGPGQFATVGVRVKVPRQKTIAAGIVAITTSEASAPIIVRVALRAQGAMVAAPTTICFGPGNSQPATVRVSVSDATGGTAKSIRALFVRGVRPLPLEVGSVRALPGTGGLTVDVTVRCTDPTARSVVGTLRVKSGKDTLDVPVVWMASVPKGLDTN